MSGKSAVDLGRELLREYRSLTSLFASDLERLLSVKGLGHAKAVQLQAVIELARRALEGRLESGVNLSSPKAVRDFLRLSFLSQDKEVFLGIFLDAQNRVLAVEELSRGTLTQTSVFPREVVKRAQSQRRGANLRPQSSFRPSRAERSG